MDPKTVSAFVAKNVQPIIAGLIDEGAELDVVVTCMVSAACCIAFDQRQSKLQARDLLYRAVQDALVVMEYKEKETKK